MTPAVTRTSAEASHRPSFWLALPLMCAVLLMVCTVSGVGERRADMGTAPLLPEVVLELSKVGARCFALLAMIASLPFICRDERFRPVVWFMLPWLLFGSWCVISTLWSPLKQISLFQSGSILAVLVVGTVIGVSICGPRDLSRIVCTLTHALVALCLGLLVLHFALPQVGALSRTALGLFHSTNGGCTAGLGLVTLVAARLLFDWTWSRRLFVPGVVVFVATLIVANNRLSLVLATFLTMGIWMIWGNRLLLALATLVGSLAAATYLTVDPGMELVTAVTGTAGNYVLQGQSDEELSSFSGRTEMWAAVWDSFQQSPWIGHGYFVTSARGEMYVWHDWNNWTAHNMYLQLAATTGFVGCLLFLSAVVWTVGTLVARFSRDTAQRPMILFCAIVASWWVGWSVLNESILGPLQPETVLFGMLLGIAASTAPTMVRDSRPHSISRHAALRPATT